MPGQVVPGYPPEQILTTATTPSLAPTDAELNQRVAATLWRANDIRTDNVLSEEQFDELSEVGEALGIDEPGVQLKTDACALLAAEPV